MATFLLIRHGDNDPAGHTLAGWSPGVHLNAAGRKQADRIAERLRNERITRIYSSPLDRALETADPLAHHLGLSVEKKEAFGEVRFGDWTGKRVDDLETDTRWRYFNSYRSGTRVPGGELMAEVQLRAA